MLVKSSGKVAFPDAEPQECQDSCGGERRCGHMGRDLRERGGLDGGRVLSASAARFLMYSIIREVGLFPHRSWNVPFCV